jgi:hypothetical protein
LLVSQSWQLRVNRLLRIRGHPLGVESNHLAGCCRSWWTLSTLLKELELFGLRLRTCNLILRSSDEGSNLPHGIASSLTLHLRPSSNSLLVPRALILFL